MSRSEEEGCCCEGEREGGREGVQEEGGEEQLEFLLEGSPVENVGVLLLLLLVACPPSLPPSFP
jgi:hypothetical protein